MRRLLITIALVCFLAGALIAASHRLRVYPKPSLTIYAMTEGPDGLLWLAASDGLYRFDGFHYHKITSYPFGWARFVAFTADGSLWAGSSEGLTRLREGRFEILTRQEVASFAAYPDRLFLRTHQLLRVGLDGALSHLEHKTLRDLNIDSSGKLWFVQGVPPQACSLDPDRPEAPECIPLSPGYQAAMRDSTGRLWVATDETASLLEHGSAAFTLRRQPSYEKRRAGPLLAGRGGELWFIGDTVHGLISKIDLRKRRDYDRYSPVSGLEDSRGRIWVASMGQGLLEWTRDPKWRHWSPENFGSGPAAQVVRANGAAFLATHTNLYRLDERTDEWLPLASQGRRFSAILPLRNGGFIASIRNLGVARLSNSGEIVERVPDLLPLPDEYREIVRDGKGRIWAAHRRALFHVEGSPGSLRLRHETLRTESPATGLNPADLEVDAAGRLWVGHSEGISWLDDQDRWHKLKTDRPVTLVRSFAIAGDDIWVAHRGPGAFTRLRRNGENWIVATFAANDGYGPVDSHFIKRDSRGWIWRGSPEGVHVSDGRRFGPGDWIHIHLGNGLATDLTDVFGFFEDADGSVWIAGADGVSHLHPETSWFDNPARSSGPQLTRLEADGRQFLFPTPLPSELPKGTKIVQIHVGGLDAPPFRDRPLRYRLLPVSKDWKLSADGTLQFSSLPEDAYTLEVSYTGSESSVVASFPFRIGPAGTGISWMWPASLLLAGGVLAPIVTRMPRFERTRFRIQKAVFLIRRRYSDRHSDSPSRPTSEVQDYSGQTLAGRYHLSRAISRGGFSVVYEARDLQKSDAPLAVKVLSRGQPSQAKIRDRFAYEVAALRTVQHPGVIRILDSWVSPAGDPCLAMPFLAGETLRSALNAGPFAPARVARLIRYLGAALNEVHACGVVHRDLKPENLILLDAGTDHEQPVIVDFGTAGLRSGEHELAATTLMAGSFHYMAPERLTGHYSPATDIFSMGVIILEMLTGSRLSDLNAMFSEASFRDELERALRAKIRKENSKILVERLSPAFNPEPGCRPQFAKLWMEQVAAALEVE